MRILQPYFCVAVDFPLEERFSLNVHFKLRPECFLRGYSKTLIVVYMKINAVGVALYYKDELVRLPLCRPPRNNYRQVTRRHVPIDVCCQNEAHVKEKMKLLTRCPVLTRFQSHHVWGSQLLGFVYGMTR